MRKILGLLILVGILVPAAPASAGTAYTADLQVSKVGKLDLTTGAHNIASVGDSIRFRGFITNLGPDVAPLLNVNYGVIRNLSFVASPSSVDCGTGVFTVFPVGQPSTCRFTNLAPGATVRVQIFATVICTTPPCTDATMLFFTDGLQTIDWTDPNPADNHHGVRFLL